MVNKRLAKEETQLDELHGKGSLEKIRLHHQRKANELGQGGREQEKRMGNLSRLHRDSLDREEGIRHHMSKVKRAKKLQRRLTKEETLDEVSADLALRSAKKAATKSVELERNGPKRRDVKSFMKNYFASSKKSDQARKFARYASKKMEEETLSELSYEKVARYHRKAADRYQTGEEPYEKRKKGRELATRKRAGGMMGIPKAKVMAKEETINEVGDTYKGREKLADYIASAAHKAQGAAVKDAHKIARDIKHLDTDEYKKSAKKRDRTQHFIRSAAERLIKKPKED